MCKNIMTKSFGGNNNLSEPDGTLMFGELKNVVDCDESAGVRNALPHQWGLLKTI